MKKILITVDGKAASGKERIAKFIGKKYKLKHLDSGILYRRLALFIKKKNINIDNENELKKTVSFISHLSYRKHKNIRTEEISKISSKIAVYGFVRKLINKIQRDFVSNNDKYKGFVVDGRDIGSVVFKKADVKLYIEVNEKNRAERRYKQLIDTGEKSIYQKILEELRLRDNKDITRKNSPLVVPKGAFIIDNNGSFKETKDQIKTILKKIIVWTKK